MNIFKSVQLPTIGRPAVESCRCLNKNVNEEGHHHKCICNCYHQHHHDCYNHHHHNCYNHHHHHYNDYDTWRQFLPHRPVLLRDPVLLCCLQCQADDYDYGDCNEEANFMEMVTTQCSCDDGDNKDLTFWSLEVDAEAFWRSLTNCSWWKSHLLAYNMDMRITDKNVN